MLNKSILHLSLLIICSLILFNAATVDFSFCAEKSIKDDSPNTKNETSANEDPNKKDYTSEPIEHKPNFSDGLMSNGWRDMLAIVGVLGVVLTALGFCLSLRSLKLAAEQLEKTRTANDAATTAGIEALDQSRKQYDRHLLNQANAHIHSSKIYVEAGKWNMAAIRLSDLADVLTHLGIEDNNWSELADRLRTMEDTFNRIAAEEIKFAKTLKEKWRELHREVSSRIAQSSVPFGPVRNLVSDSRNG